MTYRTSLQDIADSLGTSKVTVWRALNDQPGVGQKTKERILSYIETSNIDVAAFQRKKNAIEKIAYFAPHRYFFENESFYTVVHYHVNKNAVSKKIDIDMFVINFDNEKEGVLPSSFDADHYDGIFVAGEMNNLFLDNLSKGNKPIILIDFYNSHIKADSIIADNYYLGYLAASTLISNGHKDIGFIGGYKEASNIMDRYMGYSKALSEIDRSPNPESVFNINDPYTGLYSLNFPLPDPLPTAFVCHCDMAAYYLIERLKMIGKSVPEDVSVISFDNTDLSTKTTPKLTSIAINLKQFSDLAFDLLADRIENPDDRYEREYVHSEIIIRDSIKTL